MSVFDGIAWCLLGVPFFIAAYLWTVGPSAADRSNVDREGPVPLPRREPYALFDAIDSERLDARRLETA